MKEQIILINEELSRLKDPRTFSLKLSHVVTVARENLVDSNILGYSNQFVAHSAEFELYRLRSNPYRLYLINLAHFRQDL